jgi:hypothetical protein
VNELPPFRRYDEGPRLLQLLMVPSSWGTLVMCSPIDADAFGALLRDAHGARRP